MEGKKEVKRGIVSKMVWKTGKKLEQRPAEAPKSMLDVVLTLAEAMRFGYSETLAKWHLLDLPRAIIYDITDKAKKTVASECAERNDCLPLNTPELIDELYELRKYLTQTMLFSKHRFRDFLLAARFVKEDVILRKRRAKILKPAFTVIRDKESRSLVLFIRGTQSVEDTLTDAMGAPVSFDHFICIDGELKRNDTISGHAHRGMVASASWIRDRCTTTLHKNLCKYPNFKIKIVGHSLGGGTAALLTFMLREIKEFASCTCVTFGPAACMSMELAEFGKPFITTIINNSDIVPTLSASSAHHFISEGLIKRKKFLSSIRNSVTSFGSRLPFASRVKGIAEHVKTRRNQVAARRKQIREVVRNRSLALPWSRGEKIEALQSSKSDNLAEASRSYEATKSDDEDDNNDSSSEGSDHHDEEEQFMYANNKNITVDEELLNQLEDLELEKHDEEKEVVDDPHNHTAESTCPVTTSSSSSNKMDTHTLYPPGRILHIVSVPNSNCDDDDYDDEKKAVVCLYETPRELYGKLRLSKRMIFDHFSSTYFKMLQRLIDQLEKEHRQYRA